MDLSTFVERIEKEGLRVRGIEVYQHGRKIASRRWAPNYRYPLHSLSKSFTSLAIGMLVDVIVSTQCFRFRKVVEAPIFKNSHSPV